MIAFDVIGKNIAATMFNIAGGVSQVGTFKPKVDQTGAYNAVTDTYDQSGVASYTVMGIFYRSHEQRLTEDAGKTAYFLIQASELVNQGYTAVPTSGDDIVIAGVTWNIYDVDPDPSGATYPLKIRK